jgi:hypothetical protein
MAMGENFRIPTNYEWMTMALNIEAQNENWYHLITDNPSTRAAADSYLNMGNHLNNRPEILDGIIPLLGKEKRTHYLKNGLTGNHALIWDLSGNLWEWTIWSKYMAHTGIDQVGSNLGEGPWQIFNDTSNILTKNYNLLPQSIYDGQISTYNTEIGLGTYIRSPLPELGAPLRGGAKNYGGSSIFTLNLQYSTDASPALASARCVYIPIP